MKRISISSVSKALMAMTMIAAFHIGAAQDFNPNNLQPEYFNSKEVVNKMEFQESGETYRVTNSDYSRGVSIKVGNSWKKHGVWYSMYEGRITGKSYYEKGLRNGPKEDYHRNGEVQFFQMYKDSKRHGKYYQYRDDGTMSNEANYEYGLKEGEEKDYERSGNVQFRKTWKNGKLHGTKYQYNSKGKIVAETVYQDGKQIGKTKWYH